MEEIDFIIVVVLCIILFITCTLAYIGRRKMKVVWTCPECKKEFTEQEALRYNFVCPQHTLPLKGERRE